MTYFHKNIYFIIGEIYREYLVSSVGITLQPMDRTVQGWDPRGSEIFLAVHRGSKAYPASYVMGTEFSPVKRPEHGANQPPACSVGLRTGWIYTYSPSVFA